MKDKKQQLSNAMFIMGIVLIVLFISFKPWIYVTEGKEYLTTSDFESNKGNKISINTTVFSTGYNVLDKNGEIKYTVYAVIIGDKLVFLPDSNLLVDEKFAERQITGIISIVSQNQDLKLLKQTIGQKYENPTAVGIDIPSQISSYYIEPNYSNTMFFVFLLLGLGVLFLVISLVLYIMYHKSDAYNNPKMLFTHKPDEINDVKKSLLKEAIYCDDYIQISRKYLSCGTENIKLILIKSYELLENELIITLGNGKKVVIPATEPWQYNSIQRAYQALDVYLPELQS